MFIERLKRRIKQLERSTLFSNRKNQDFKDVRVPYVNYEIYKANSTMQFWLYLWK